MKSLTHNHPLLDHYKPYVEGRQDLLKFTPATLYTDTYHVSMGALDSVGNVVSHEMYGSSFEPFDSLILFLASVGYVVEHSEAENKKALRDFSPAQFGINLSNQDYHRCISKDYTSHIPALMRNRPLVYIKVEYVDARGIRYEVELPEAPMILKNNGVHWYWESDRLLIFKNHGENFWQAMTKERLSSSRPWTYNLIYAEPAFGKPTSLPIANEKGVTTVYTQHNFRTMLDRLKDWR